MGSWNKTKGDKTLKNNLNKMNIGLIGIGTIGPGVVKTLQDTSELIEKRTGVKINLKKTVVIRIEDM